MNEKLKRRITMFYIAGVVNLVIGVYVLVFGHGFLTDQQYFTVVAFFLGFAAVDFIFPRMIKKKWMDDQAKLEAQRQALANKPPQR